MLPQVERLLFEPGRAPEVRLAAIAACNRIASPGEATEQPLLELLEAVNGGEAADPDGELTGTLLRLLYPEKVTPDVVWHYFFERPGIPIGGRCWQFWNEGLLVGAETDELCELLDGFARESDRFSGEFGPAPLDHIAGDMLMRALRESDLLVPEDVYVWLLAVLDQRRSWSGIRTEKGPDVVAWLRDQPNMHKSLMRLWLTDSVRSPYGPGHFEARLLFASLPDDFVRWCATEAIDWWEADTELAHAFVELPFRCSSELVQSPAEIIEQLRSELSTEPTLVQHLEDYFRPPPARGKNERREREHQHKLDEIRAEHERERQQQQSDWRALLRESRNDLVTNCLPAPNLHALALAYFGLLVDVTGMNEPGDRIVELIGDNAELRDAVMKALRDAPMRAEVPSVQRTVQLAADSKHDWLAYPVLAGLSIRESEGSLDATPLSDEFKRNALAIHATAPLMPSQYPKWPERWLNEDPELVLETLRRCALAAMDKGDTSLSMLNWLNGVDGFEDELHDFRLGLLRSIPVRLPVAQLPVLDELLLLVSKHPDTVPLKELAAQKLRAKSMTDAQRVRWMTLDTIMSNGDALGSLDDFIGTNEKRARQLAELLSTEAHHSAGLTDRLCGSEPCTTLHTLIGVIGRNFRPHQWKNNEAVWIGPSETMSDLVEKWINDLAGLPAAEAGAAFDDLIADERLRSWRSRLEHARNQQRRLHRDASHTPINVADVLGLLGDGPPANVADLHVLLIDRLRDLGSHIRGDNSDPWRQFWADDHESQPEKPKHEDSCRDALLAMLHSRLPEGVGAEPEGQYAANRRADIRVGSKDFNIPVEIKKNTHPDLWTAIPDQLIAKYTTDPATGGYGIYLVLWFGMDEGGYPLHPTDRDRPSTPDELEIRLRESMSHEQRRTISVVVLDVTKP